MAVTAGTGGRSTFERNRERLQQEAARRRNTPGTTAYRHAQGQATGNGETAYGLPSSADASDRWINDALAAQQANANDGGGYPRGGGGGGRGYGYGGGGGVSAAKIAESQAAMLQQLLRSKAFQAQGRDEDFAAVQSALGADRTANTDAYNNMMNTLTGVKNPYQYEVAAAPRVDPGLRALIEQQGGSTAEYDAGVQLANTEGAANRAAAQNTRQALEAAFKESMGSRRVEAGQRRDSVDQALGADARAMEMALRERVRQDEEAVKQQRMQVLMQLISAMSQQGKEQDITGLLGQIGL